MSLARADARSAIIGPSQFGNVELHHLHHGLHDALPLRWISVFHHGDKLLRHDLPGHPELIFEPAALFWLTAVGRQRGPQTIDLVLVNACHRERDRIIELVMQPTVQSLVGEARERELHEDDIAGLAAGPVDTRLINMIDA